MRYLASEIAEIVGGDLYGSNNTISEVIFDSRSVFNPTGAIFIALSGALSNGHNYIPQLISQGVSSFLVTKSYIASKGVANTSDKISYIAVEEPLTALQLLASHYRSQLNSLVVAVTGSNGKSIVKEWIHQLITDFPLFRSPKSYNSQLGVALSLLLIPEKVDVAVIEAGISQPNEMGKLEKMIKPSITIITNIGEAHGENFTSVESKLNEKLILTKGCSKIVVNSQTAKMIDNSICRERLFIWGSEGDVDIKIHSTDRGAIEFSYLGCNYLAITPFNDSASYENIMSVISLGALLNIDIETLCRRTELLSPVPMRLEIIDGVDNSVIINDCYNSDYNSLSVALSHLNNLSIDGKRVVILSDIVGSARNEEELYSDVAQLLNNSKVNELIAIGSKIGTGLNQRFNGVLRMYSTTEEYLQSIHTEDLSNKTVLVKGCRNFGFERITERLQARQHTSVIEVNIDSLIQNYRLFRSYLKPTTKMVAMVKAMAYGNGYYEVALALQNSGVDYLAVAYIDEGIELRERGITTPIIILNSNPYDYPKIFEYNLEPEIYNFYSLEQFSREGARLGVKHYPIHIKLDTGMHRMGFMPNEIEELKSLLKNNTTLKVSSIFSHLSSSDDPMLDNESERQIEEFIKGYTTLDFPDAIKHICNSCGVIRFPHAHFDMVRVGLGLYGITSLADISLKDVTSLHSTILQIKRISKGDYVGYNIGEVATKDSVIAILSIGYADGLNRKLGRGRWSVKLKGKRYKIIGNISMDTCAVDITGADAKEGDRVTIISGSQDFQLISEIIDTIPYEILTAISTRIKRVYVRE